MPAIANPLDPANPLAWLLASLAIAVLGSNLAWLLLGRRRRNTMARSRAGTFAALAWFAAAVYMLILPLFAWERGVLSPYALGVTEPQWLETASLGLPVAAVTVGLFLFGWLVYRRSVAAPAGDATARPGVLERMVDAVRAPLDAALCQWHWAFYRGLAIGWLAGVSLHGVHAPPLAALFGSLQAQPFYWGSWLGLAWAGLEWMLNPFSRAALRSQGTQEAALRGVALAIATTALFTLTRNFWLCLACHVLAETLVVALFPLPLSRPAVE